MFYFNELLDMFLSATMVVKGFIYIGGCICSETHFENILLRRGNIPAIIWKRLKDRPYLLFPYALEAGDTYKLSQKGYLTVETDYKVHSNGFFSFLVYVTIHQRNVLFNLDDN